jgi:hypothetical protein
MSVVPSVPTYDRYVSRKIDHCRTLLTNGDTVDDAWHGGRTPLNGGGANGIPKGRWIGRIWHRLSDGVWYATPEDINWSDLIWYGPFYSRREAATFLMGMTARKPDRCPCCGKPALFTREGHIINRDGSEHPCSRFATMHVTDGAA